MIQTFNSYLNLTLSQYGICQSLVVPSANQNGHDIIFMQLQGD